MCKSITQVNLAFEGIRLCILIADHRHDYSECLSPFLTVTSLFSPRCLLLNVTYREWRVAITASVSRESWIALRSDLCNELYTRWIKYDSPNAFAKLLEQILHFIRVRVTANSGGAESTHFSVLNEVNKREQEFYNIRFDYACCFVQARDLFVTPECFFGLRSENWNYSLNFVTVTSVLLYRVRA